jgi:hypothetical protein
MAQRGNEKYNETRNDHRNAGNPQAKLTLFDGVIGLTATLLRDKIRTFRIRVIRGSPNDSALASLDELDDFDDLFRLG